MVLVSVRGHVFPVFPLEIALGEIGETENVGGRALPRERSRTPAGSGRVSGVDGPL